MNRRVAPFLAAVLLAAGIYWAVDRFGVQDPVPAPTTRPASREPESRPASVPESLPAAITTTPFAEPEREPESRPESAPTVAIVVIEVAREDGRPIADATIAGDVEEAVSVGADGRAEIPARPGSVGEIRVQGPNFRCVRVSVPLDPGTHRVVVPDGSRVAGRVTVDGRVPEDPISMRIDSAPDVPRGDCGNDPNLWAAVSADGSFEFFNLPATWNGDLGAPCEFAMADKIGDPVPEHDSCARSRMTLVGPGTGLAVRLVSLPAIKGRVVTSSIDAAAEGAVVHATFRIRDEAPGSHLRTNEDGRFRVVVPEGAEHATVVVSDTSGLGARAFDVQGPFVGVRDLGLIDLRPVRRIEVRVRDADGNPLAGALAAINGTRSIATATDEAGATVISADLTPVEMRVVKPGYATATVALPADATGPVEVTLRPGSLLRIEARLPDGSPPVATMARVRLSANGPMFGGPDDMSDDLHALSGAAGPIEEHLGGGGSSALYHPDDQGIVAVAGLLPGTLVAVELRGALLDEVLADALVVVETGGTRTVTLVAPGVPQSFAAMIRTAGGDPIDGATLMAWVDGGEPVEAVSGAAGECTFAPVFALAVHVDVIAPAFLPLRLRNVPVPPPGGRRDFILSPACDLSILLVDEAGRQLREPAEVLIDVGGAPGFPLVVSPEMVEEGYFLAFGLPPRIVSIDVVVGATRVVVEHDLRIPAANVVIPTEGYAQLTWTRPEGEGRRLRMVLRSLTLTMPGVETDLDPDSFAHAADMTLDPGIYEASIEAEDEDSGEWTEIAASWFTVLAHSRTQVAIGE